MKGLSWPSCVLLINYVINYVTTTVPSPPSDSPSNMELTCMLDEDNLNPELATCLEKGNQYLNRYLTELRLRATPWHFDKCSEIQELRDCLRPLMSNCPSIRRLYAEWATVVDAIECSCNNSSTSCDADLSCFEDQASGILVRRCDAYYRFNIDQHTRTRCHFTEQNIRCKEALMTTACGSAVGDFAFSLYLANSSRRTKKHTCDIPRHSDYREEFQYSDRCPADFPDTMEQCRQQHLMPTTLTFLKDNDLVASGRKADIRESCRGYRDYRSCVRPIKLSCRKGMNLVYDYDGRLRTYLIKMDYICGEHKREYVEHLPCFRDMLREKRLTRCDDTWNLLDSMLDSVTSHTFYCRRRSNESTQLRIVLDELRQCYEKVLHDSCGVAGGDTLGRLMNSVLDDPFYLRYKYKPDCKLHSVPQIMQQEEPRESYSEQIVATTPVSKPVVKSSPFTTDANAALVKKSQTSLVLFCILLSLLSLVSR